MGGPPHGLHGGGGGGGGLHGRHGGAPHDGTHLPLGTVPPSPPSPSTSRLVMVIFIFIPPAEGSRTYCPAYASHVPALAPAQSSHRWARSGKNTIVARAIRGLHYFSGMIITEMHS